MADQISDGRRRSLTIASTHNQEKFSAKIRVERRGGEITVEADNISGSEIHAFSYLKDRMATLTRGGDIGSSLSISSDGGENPNDIGHMTFVLGVQKKRAKDFFFRVTNHLK